MLPASPAIGDAMTDFNASQIKQQAFGTPKVDPAAPNNAPGKVEDLTGTERLLDLGRRTSKPVKPAKKQTAPKPSSKRGALATKPTRSVQDAIKEGVPAKELEALLKDWAKFNLQEARQQAKAATEAMAMVAEQGRRKIADELLKLADGYGISMDDAKKIFSEALAAKVSSKHK
jgi:predicted DNA-binding protein (UPF0251 family)